MFIILTGKTASGKDTILGLLLQKYPTLRKIITTTSRKPREGEKVDLDYHFLSEDEFKQKIVNGEFVEFVDYGGKLYGTTKAELTDLLTADHIWKIDPSRAGKIREFLKQAFPAQEAQKIIEQTLVIYITVPYGVIIERLKKRALPPEEIDKRMKQDAKDWDQYKNKYDYVIENLPGKLEETLQKITQIIEAQK